ncbi:protein phosphatase [Sagittula sp. SSi028]|uniref:protein phosphatase n=1 Tax=Sagittula sp. SSi028 TaxID=3400636 RepID=UPI003AF7423E
MAYRVHDLTTPTVTGTPVTMHGVPVGGGIVIVSALPGSGGDLHGDLDHLASWQPAMVISVLSSTELAARGAWDLRQRVQDSGARWAHLAASAQQAAPRAMQDLWPQVSDQARRALLGGGRIVLQSPGGAGRCGMVLLRLMIEAGEAPDDAQARIAQICPQTIGTAEQIAWALQARRSAVPFVRHLPSPRYA